MLRQLSYILLIPLVTLLSCAEKRSDSTALSSGDQISYNFHIRPILSDNCFACHGPDENKRESGLRLDNA
ncbi:c-type cytochrome domain-containing protein, partial [uncultured Cyclobacterium sp.]|uniref:c-type cytochrome domain-containing protein n=1 Tax=uncultured Cyclobacterium sp. TaxID=453820 RepID=UPI0030ED0AB2